MLYLPDTSRANLPPELGRPAQLPLDFHELVVLAQALAVAHEAGLDLPAVHGHGKVD